MEADDDVIKSYTYDAYGNTDSTGTFVNSFAYTGAVIDEETGLYYMNARYYEPETGRFISEDTYRGEGEVFWNLYMYCDGDPVNCTDPSGHKKDHVIYYYNKKSHGNLKEQGRNLPYISSKGVNYYQVGSNKGFIKAWNSIKASKVKNIFIVCHGGPGKLYFWGESLTASDLSKKLKSKYISGYVVLFACHGGENSKGKASTTGSVAGILATKTHSTVFAAYKTGVSFTSDNHARFETKHTLNGKWIAYTYDKQKREVIHSIYSRSRIFNLPSFSPGGGSFGGSW